MFIKKPASKNSLSNRKPIYGIGINDADYIVQPKINGEQVCCHYYQKWKSMIGRCYNYKTKINRRTYIDCDVCDEWLVFSNFKAWMKKQDWQGKELDKDILFQGNKIYSPNTCLFVKQNINALLTNRSSLRGDHPQGVSFDKSSGKYKAKCNVNGNGEVSIGRFKDPKSAFNAYKEFKYKLIKEIANKQSEPLRTALLSYEIQG